MPTSEAVTLARATERDAPLLANLLELYVHDLSSIFDVEIGADGRFGYDKLPLYWKEPDRRWAHRIEHGGRVVGFALVVRGSTASDDPDVLDVAEFFVLRRHRRSGVGRAAAFGLWNAMPGRWTVRVSERNQAALAFWRETIAAYAPAAFVEETRARLPGWRVFAFASRPRSTAKGTS